MGRRNMARKLPRYVSSIQCPVDLDTLVMSSDCTPEFIEENMNVGDDIFWDAISTSTCSYWLLKMDVMEQFSKDMRRRIFWALPAFNRMSRVYFYIQLMNSTIHEPIRDELHEWESQNPSETDRDSAIGMINPMNMLSNNLKEWDRKIVNGELTLRRFLLDRIRGFLDSGKKDDVDFSHSLFLPELLSPKFFKNLSEAEHIVILGNLDKYFSFVQKFNNTGISFSGSFKPGKELNPPQNLVRHILSGDYPYTNRVKMIAWRQLFKEIGQTYGKFTAKTGVFKIIQAEAVNKMLEELKKNKLEPNGLKIENIWEWLFESEGVFESFELDCTLHNLDASDFFIPILCVKEFHEVAEGLVNFQDDATRDRLFRQLSDAMLSCR